MALRGLQRRFVAPVPTSDQNASRPRGTRAWVWVLLVIVVVAIYLTSSSKQPPRNQPPPKATPGWVYLIGSVSGAVIVAIILLGVRVKNLPLIRAGRKANAGDVAGAIADVQARIDRRYPPTAPVESANPWAAPASALSTADRKVLAIETNALGILEGMRDGWTEALAWFERAEAFEPTNPVCRANQGYALAKLGQTEVGLARIGQALADLPVTDDFNRYSMSIQLARTLIDSGRGSEAHAVLDGAEAASRRIVVLRFRGKKAIHAEIATLRDRARSASLEESIAPRSVPDRELSAGLDAQGDRR